MGRGGNDGCHSTAELHECQMCCCRLVSSSCHPTAARDVSFFFFYHQAPTEEGGTLLMSVLRCLKAVLSGERRSREGVDPYSLSAVHPGGVLHNPKQGRGVVVLHAQSRTILPLARFYTDYTAILAATLQIPSHYRRLAPHVGCAGRNSSSRIQAGNRVDKSHETALFALLSTFLSIRTPIPFRSSIGPRHSRLSGSVEPVWRGRICGWALEANKDCDLESYAFAY